MHDTLVLLPLYLLYGLATRPSWPSLLCSFLVYGRWCGREKPIPCTGNQIFNPQAFASENRAAMYSCVLRYGEADQRTTSLLLFHSFSKASFVCTYRNFAFGNGRHPPVLSSSARLGSPCYSTLAHEKAPGRLLSSNPP